MGRRRRSLIWGKGKKQQATEASEDHQPDVVAESDLSDEAEASESDGAESGDAEGVDQIQTDGDDAAADDEVAAEAPLDDSDAVTEAPESFLPSADADTHPPDALFEATGELYAPEDQSDGYTDAETVMEDDGSVDPFSDPVFVDEMAGETAQPQWSEADEEPADAGVSPFAQSAAQDEVHVDQPGDDEGWTAGAEYDQPGHAPDLDHQQVGVVGVEPGEEDLYESFDELGATPPAEEGALYSDVSTTPSGPMRVPDAPPVPGLMDRFTPLPVSRTAMGSPHAEQRPSYLATPTPAPAERAAFPARVPSPASIDDDEDDDEFDDEEEEGKLRYVALAATILACLGVLVGTVWWITKPPPEPEYPATQSSISGVDLRRQGVNQVNPSILGNLQDEDDDDLPDLVPDGEEAEQAEGRRPRRVAQPEPAPAPEPEGAPQPAPAPAPAPAPTTAATTGELAVRANRRALVLVNGQPVGYTPVDHPVAPGTYQVEVMLPGQPDTRQSRSATMKKKGGQRRLDFTF